MEYWIWLVMLLVLSYLGIKAHQQLSHFSKWGVPQPLELPFLGMSYMLFFPRRHPNELMRHLYASYKDAKYVGCHMFLGRTIIIRDLDLVKSVLVKNFDYFADRKTFVDEESDPLFGQNLNFLNGDRWKEVRNILSPSFTSSKMKMMYVLMSEAADNFVDSFFKSYRDAEAIDMKDTFSKFTNDVIASCAFGIEVDSMNEPQNEFYLQAQKCTTFKGTTLLKLLLEMMFPSVTRKLGMRIVTKEVTDFFVKVIESVIKVREEQGTTRPDMLQLMMEAHGKAQHDCTAAKFDTLEMTAQAFLFFLAGFEANSTQACLIAHELAVNPDIQSKVQLEVDRVMSSTNHKPTYEAINGNMPYLDAVISETLRKHPIAFLNRLCSKEFQLPPALPDSKPYKVEPGTGIMIPVAGIHADPDYYEDPHIFNPERFINKKVMISDISNLGFGLGPRMCIGNRFAILVTKALFVHLLDKCTLVPCKKTCIPLVYCKNNFSPVAKGGFWLKLEPRIQ